MNAAVTEHGGIGLKALSQCMSEDAQSELLSFESECSLVVGWMRSVRWFDPDILMGWNLQKESVGFIVDRAATLALRAGANGFEYDVRSEIGRVPRRRMKRDKERVHRLQNRNQNGNQYRNRRSGVDQEFGARLEVKGRIVLCLWRCSRSELKLKRYSLQNVAWHLLTERTPLLRPSVVTAWWSGGGALRAVLLEQLAVRSSLNLDILGELELIGRSSEMARLIGISFGSVLSRGSQYRVESILLRMAKPLGFVMASPSREAVSAQKAMECIPLVMEPRSLLYSEPMAVLDFQSLYPSVMIANNICYSTCLGALCDPLPAGLGAVGGYRLSEQFEDGLRLCSDDVWLSPNGVMFCTRSVRKGVLCQMVDELLQTRIMTKATMKAEKRRRRGAESNGGGQDIARLLKQLDARQFALKLMSNVTYGYTSAGFSGRMPCAEIADSIVETGRQCLMETIRVIEGGGGDGHGRRRWSGAKVVYGDTDSVFVLLPGRSLAAAFRIGQEMAAVITALFGHPIKLKFEKIYFPAMLLAKKRYVGWMREDGPSAIPSLDAKGIEVIRRDQCPLVQDTMRRVLEMVLRPEAVRNGTPSSSSTAAAAVDVERALRRYLVEEVWSPILSQKVPIDRFVFSKAVRLGTYSKAHRPPAAVVAERRLMTDSRAFPLSGQRVQYLVISAKPNSKLSDMVIEPLLFDHDRHSVNALYYITKQLNPAIGRMLEVMAIDIDRWFRRMTLPKPRRNHVEPLHVERTKAVTLHSFYRSKHCLLCRRLTEHRYFCADCRTNTGTLCLVVAANTKAAQRTLHRLRRACSQCIGRQSMANRLHIAPTTCSSLECPLWFSTQKAVREYSFWSQIHDIVQLK